MCQSEQLILPLIDYRKCSVCGSYTPHKWFGDGLKLGQWLCSNHPSVDIEIEFGLEDEGRMWETE